MNPGLVRIIAGSLRGRRLKVPTLPHLRPTPDRVRETLFNWLNPYLPGAKCLDVFAGTGALGFEAISRGAAYVEMVDNAYEVIELLKQTAQAFRLESVTIYQAKVPEQLHPPQKPYNIVFLDPPYQANLLLPTCFYLEEQGFLATTAYIYLEANAGINDQDLPLHWRLVKSGRAGQVYYHLAKREIL